MATERHLVSSRRPVTSQHLIKYGAGNATLTGNLTLTKRSSQYLRLDPGGATRTVTLPAFEDGLYFYLLNTASDAGEDLVVSDGSTVATLLPGQAAMFVSDGSDWYHHGVMQTVAAEGFDEKEVLSASGTIAAGAVATLNATPVTVIAAPAAGYYIEVLSCHWFLDFESAAYDGPGAGEDLALKYTDASGAQVTGVVDHDGFGNAVADAHALVQAVPVVPVAAAPIVAHILVGEWFAAAGDSPVKYEILYRVRSLAL